MLGILISGALATAGALQEHRPPSPPPIPAEPINPQTREDAVTYSCGGQESRYTLRYNQRGFEEMVLATRRGVSADAAALSALNQVLRTLPGFQLWPRCGGSYDWIDVGTPTNPRAAIGGIRWSGSLMEFIFFPSEGGQR